MRKLLFTAFMAMAMIVPVFAAQPSGTLPVLVIETQNHQAINSKDTYVAGTYYLDPRGVEGVEAIGSAESPLPLQIKGRGNYTWWAFNKKPYRIKLDKKAALLGMNSSKHFALMAHADDSRAFMRNLTGFEVSRMAGMPWTPADQPCEVILNGDYIGLYFLTETIRFAKTRINLTNPDDVVSDWLTANQGATVDDYPFTEDDYTGAWLVEFDNTQDANQVYVDSRQGTNVELWVTYKTPEDYVTDAHRQWLRKEFDTIDALIYADNNAEGAWLNKIDLTDAARFFVVNQIMNNYESYTGSCYLYKDKGADQKWHFGPVWDFGSSFQVSRDVSRWIWESQYAQHWIKNMWNCPAFQAEVKRIFEAMAAEGFDRIFNYQNEYAERIRRAAQSDAERWKSNGYGNPDMDTPLAEVQKQLRDAINSFGNKLGLEGYTKPEPIVGPIYLRGTDLGGWNVMETYKFTDLGNNIYQLKVNHLSGPFKIADSQWDVVDYGGTENDLVNINQPYSLVERGSNMQLASGSAENVTLRFDLNNKSLTISDLSGVDLVVETSNAPVEYFNLQGMKVTQPQPGDIYIAKKGNRAYKIIYR